MNNDERIRSLEVAAEHWQRRLTQLQIAVRQACYDVRLECGALQLNAEAGERMVSENAIDAAQRIVKLINELRDEANQ